MTARDRRPAQLEELAARCQNVAEQIDRRARTEGHRSAVSLADRDARTIRRGTLGKPTEFGYVAQICEVTENARKGAGGFILPAGHSPGISHLKRRDGQNAGHPIVGFTPTLHSGGSSQERSFVRPLAPGTPSSSGLALEHRLRFRRC